MSEYNIKPVDVPCGLWNSAVPAMYTADLTIQELVYKIAFAMNETIKTQNTVLAEWKVIKEWVENQLQQYAEEVMQRLVDEGAFDELVQQWLAQFLDEAKIELRAYTDTKTAETLTASKAYTDTGLNTKQTKVYNKAIIVGDSWAVGYYDGQGHLGQGWGDYACPLLGVSANNILTVASGGSGFINGTGEHFSDQIKRAYNDYTDFRNADIIICVGGFNDAQDNQAFDAVQAAAGLFFSNCKKYFPKAETHMFPLQLPYGPASAMSAVRWNVLSAIKQAFYNQTAGNLFIHDGVRRWANSFGNGASAEDGAHLNQHGYSYMGQLIAMSIRKGLNYYPTLKRAADFSSLGAKAKSVIRNEIVEDNGNLTINITFSAEGWDSEYIKLPDIARVTGTSYFWNGSHIMVWNENGIKPNTTSITGLVCITLTVIAGR